MIKIYKFFYYITHFIQYFLKVRINYFLLKKMNYSNIGSNLQKGSQNPLQEINCEKIDQKQIQKIQECVKKNQPIILRGILNHFPDLKKWGFDYLQTIYGDLIVTVNTNGRRNCQPSFKKVKISELIENIKRGCDWYLTFSEEASAIYQMLDFSEDCSKSLIDFKNLICRKNIKKISPSEIFIGGKNTGTRWHCAIEDNFFLMIRGKKRWEFISPKDSPFMYPLIRNHTIYIDTNINYSGEGKNQKYKLFSNTSIYFGEIDEGDGLISPQWWWHTVENKNHTIGIACRTWNSYFKGHFYFSSLFLINLFSKGRYNHILRKETYKNIKNELFTKEDKPHKQNLL